MIIWSITVLHTVVVQSAIHPNWGCRGMCPAWLEEVPKKRPQFVRKVRIYSVNGADDTSRCFNLIMTYIE